MSKDTGQKRPAEILMVEDNAGDVRLAIEAFKESGFLYNLTTVHDGKEAILFLRKEGRYRDTTQPDIILLDLNLPKIDGREVLIRIKTDPDLKRIPVVVLTSSKADDDISKAYDTHANSYITKPINLEAFIGIVKSIEKYWLSVVTLPSGKYKEENN
ncbi:MAG: response regulator [Spirochaetes bacterium]|nr:response regulator [Spirochaetota bacterium]